MSEMAVRSAALQSRRDSEQHRCWRAVRPLFPMNSITPLTRVLSPALLVSRVHHADPPALPPLLWLHLLVRSAR